MSLTQRQRDFLLHPEIQQSRIANRSQSGKTFSYVEAWDIRRTLIRAFGFGGFSAEVVDARLMFEEQVPKNNGGTNWSVAYLVTVRLTIHGIDDIATELGDVERDAIYTESAVGEWSMPSRADAHDNAVKTGTSDALKRAAINLGTQFGLSLYAKTTGDVVVRTADTDDATPDAPNQQGREVAESEDAEADSARKGDTDIAPDAPNREIAEAERRQPPANEDKTTDPAAEEWANRFRTAMQHGDVEEVVRLNEQMNAAGVADLRFNGKTLATIKDLAVIGAGKQRATMESIGTRVDEPTTEPATETP